ncbi:MAG: glycosyltransferase [Spirochaetota bacterium]
MSIAGTITLLLAIPAAGIVVVHLITAVGVVLTSFKEKQLLREAARVEASREKPPRSVSVIVPAKNEQYALPRLLESLKNQDTDEFEIVLVNDRSSDNTEKIMEEFKHARGHGVTVVTIEEAPEGANPKQNALAHGAAVAGGELLLLTDADCVVPREWVSRSARYFADERLGLIFGPVIPNDLRTFLSQYQSFDHVFRYFYTAGSSGIGNATGGFGNNLAVLREALDAVGGFAGLRHSVTEDAELISEVRDQQRWLIRAHISRDAAVHPQPQRSIGGVLKQGLRWNTGAFFSPDWMTRLSYATVMGFLFVGVVVSPLALLFTPVLLLPAGAFVSMVLMAIVAGAFTRRPASYWFLLLPNVVFSMLFYSLVTLLTLLRARISWKGSTIRTR